jgi:DNA-binding response OmpR family regulator
METIMIHETDADTTEVVTVAFQMEGYQVFRVTDADENILEMIRRHHPRLVFLDYRPGVYAGRRIFHWIKAHFPKLPVITASLNREFGGAF